MGHKSNYKVGSMKLFKINVVLGAMMSLVLNDTVMAEGIEKIMVTAQRKAESMQEVGIAISAFSEDDLKDMGVTQPVDIAAQTPALFIKNGIGSANPYISIRNVGQSLFVTNASQPVGMYMNDINLSYTNLMSMPLFDIERVEVLKGPQGTLFGRNSTAGALSIFTAQPIDDNEGGITVQVGNNALIEAEGFVNFEWSDSVASRVSFMKKKQDGFYTNTLTGNDLGNTDLSALRFSTKWESDNFTTNLVLEANRDRSGNTPWSSFGTADPSDPVTNADLIALGTVTGDGVDFSQGNAFGRNEVYGNSSFVTGFDGSLGTDSCSESNSLNELIAANVAGRCVTHTGHSGSSDLYTGAYSLEPQLIHDLYSAMLNVDYRFENTTLTSVTGYITSDRTLDEEFDGTSAISADNTYHSETTIWSQELRLSGEQDNFSWVTGAYIAHDKVETDDRYVYDDIWFFTHLVDFTQETDNFGIFAHTDWSLSEELSLILDARYTNETISFDGGNFVVDVIDSDIDVQGYGLPLEARQITRPVAGQEETESNEVTWKVGLELSLIHI